MVDLLKSTLFYGSALAVLLGLGAVARPMRRLALPTRSRGLVVMAIAVCVAAAVSFPTPAVTSVQSPRTQLDTFAPTFHFREIHETRIAASPDAVYAAIKAVTADEIALFRTFTWIRRFGRPLPPGIMNAPGSQSILDTALRGGFLLLAEDAPREIVFGTLAIRPVGFRVSGPPTPEMYRALDAPGIAKATMNFLVEPEGNPPSSRVVTETRVVATDERALRVFTRYWRVIYPGSAILRVTWLRAIKSRAEGPNPF